MDELDSRPVKPDLLSEFGSMVPCTPNAQLVGLTVDAFKPLVHLEHFAEQSLGVVLQSEQLGVAHAQHTPIQLDLPWPLALSFCFADLVDFTARLLVGELLVGIYFLGHSSTLPPSRLVDLAG